MASYINRPSKLLQLVGIYSADYNSSEWQGMPAIPRAQEVTGLRHFVDKDEERDIELSPAEFDIYVPDPVSNSLLIWLAHRML